MIYLLYTIHVVVSIFLILVVLLQQGKGADLSVFGGGSTQTAFGARGAATVLHKLTVVCFIGFIFTTLGIAVMKTSGRGSSVIDDDVAPVEATLEEAADDAALEESAAPGDAVDGELGDSGVDGAAGVPGAADMAEDPSGGEPEGGTPAPEDN